MKQICDGNLLLYSYSFLWFIEIEIEYMYTWKVYFHIVLLFVVSQMHLVCIKSIFMDILSGNWFIRTNEICLLKNILSDHSCKLLFMYIYESSFLFMDHSFFKLFANNSKFIQILFFIQIFIIYSFFSQIYIFWSTNLKSNINKDFHFSNLNYSIYRFFKIVCQNF